MKQLCIVILCLGLATAARADVKIVQKVKSGPMMGQPAKDTTVTMYVKGHKARNETATGKSYQLIDIDAGKVYIVEPDKKQVVVMTTEMMKKTVGMMSQLTGGSQTKPKVEKLGTSHTYSGYKCDDVKVTMSGQAVMNFTSVSCISAAVDIKEFEPFKEFSQDFVKAFGVDMSGGIQGYPVHSEVKMNMMGQNIDSTTDLLSISHDKLPDSLFAVPPDYKVQEMKMPQSQKQ